MHGEHDPDIGCVNDMYEHDPYIECVNESYDSTKHYRQSVQGQTVLNMQFLEDLYNKGILPPTEECGVFEPLSSRRKHCSMYSPSNWPGILGLAVSGSESRGFIRMRTN